MFPFYLGIDLHLKRSYLVLMNTEGEVIDKRRLKNTEMASVTITKKIPKETCAVMEAGREKKTPDLCEVGAIAHLPPFA